MHAVIGRARIPEGGPPRTVLRRPRFSPLPISAEPAATIEIHFFFSSVLPSATYCDMWRMWRCTSCYLTPSHSTSHLCFSSRQRPQHAATLAMRTRPRDMWVSLTKLPSPLRSSKDGLIAWRGVVHAPTVQERLPHRPARIQTILLQADSPL